MYLDNLEMLQDTLRILKQGYYTADDKRVNLKLSPKQMEEIQVFLPADIERICADKAYKHVYVAEGRIEFGCENADSFELARQIQKEMAYLSDRDKKQTVLVLNLANPVIREAVYGGEPERRKRIFAEKVHCFCPWKALQRENIMTTTVLFIHISAQML